MSFREILTDFYQVHTEEKVVVDGREGLISDGKFYFNTNAQNFETIHLEQAVLAYYLLENGYQQIALPVQNKNEEWFTDYGNSRVLVFRTDERRIDDESTGKKLAQFHQVGSAYGYEPASISSYGKWKKLWVDKMTLFEERIIPLVKEESERNKQLIADALPYIIGMSENAIQYLRETESEEMRYSEMDQGSIAFLRFATELDGEMIWPDQFVYDHPARDVAEYIRAMLLSGQSDKMIAEFLRDYQITRPLSLFSWRLVYARLLYPIHLFDAIEQSFQENHTHEFQRLLNGQHNYEIRLKNFFNNVGVDREAAGIAEVEWL